VFQTFADGLLTISRIWRHGVRSDALVLRAAVDSTVTALSEIAGMINICPLYHKAHELRHILYDFEYFGAACWISSGDLPVHPRTATACKDVHHGLLVLSPRNIRNEAQRSEGLFQDVIHRDHQQAASK
jgi:hypothetical protein